MARQRRLLLAHTGWATVVDPRGRDDMERTVIGAIGPEGQSPIAPVRKAAATAEAVRTLAERLVRAGLAVPEGDGRTVAEALRRLRLAVPAVAGLAVVALLMPVPSQMPRLLVALWFALPLVFTLGCLAIARFELSPASPWASPAGQRLLASVRQAADGDTDDDRAYLTSVAVRGCTRWANRRCAPPSRTGSRAWSGEPVADTRRAVLARHHACRKHPFCRRRRSAPKGSPHR